MQDAIIKGSGNSRYLKSVANFATLYPTYADFVQALVEGTLPIDLNGTNAAGFTQTGTALNKANLLSDSTETAIFGSAGNRTVDATLAKLLSTIQTVDGAAAKIQVGSYVGTGTYGAANPCSLTFDSKPAFFTIVDMSYPEHYGGDVYVYGQTKLATYKANPGYARNLCYCSWDGNTLTYYATDAPDYQLNINQNTYVFVAVLE